MITVTTHEAISQLSALLTAVEERGETVIIWRNGKPAAELRAIAPAARSQIIPDPTLRVLLSPGFDPTEGANNDEWPKQVR